MPSLTDYLAKNYLTASTATGTDSSNTRPTKKRKKNKTSGTEATNTLLIADDDDGLLLSSRNGGDDNNNNNNNDNDGPMMFDTKVRSAEFRKSKKNAWQTIRNGADGSSNGNSGSRRNNNNEDEADVLLREAMATNAQSRADLEAENAPAVVEETSASGDGPRMESGARAGLQTAADTARLVAEQEAREEAEEKEARARAARRKKKNKHDDDNNNNEAELDGDKEEETIYRDATGRRIDLTLRRQEARRAEQERIAAEKKERDNALGEVQLRQREQRKQELEDAKFLTVARGADDEEMNNRMRGEIRWNDPMAAYMANKRDEEENASTAVTQKSSSHNHDRGGQLSRPGELTRSKTKRREYTGAAPPNRYGIKPGWRWDGVDRGNGFEKDWFQARGRKARNESLEYQWQMDE